MSDGLDKAAGRSSPASMREGERPEGRDGRGAARLIDEGTQAEGGGASTRQGDATGAGATGLAPVGDDGRDVARRGRHAGHPLGLRWGLAQVLGSGVTGREAMPCLPFLLAVADLMTVADWLSWGAAALGLLALASPLLTFALQYSVLVSLRMAQTGDRASVAEAAGKAGLATILATVSGLLLVGVSLAGLGLVEASVARCALGVHTVVAASGLLAGLGGALPPAVALGVRQGDLPGGDDAGGGQPAVADGTEAAGEAPPGKAGSRPAAVTGGRDGLAADAAADAAAEGERLSHHLSWMSVMCRRPVSSLAEEALRQLDEARRIDGEIEGRLEQMFGKGGLTYSRFRGVTDMALSAVTGNARAVADALDGLVADGVGRIPIFYDEEPGGRRDDEADKERHAALLATADGRLEDNEDLLDEMRALVAELVGLGGQGAGGDSEEALEEMRRLVGQVGGYADTV